MISYIKNCNK